MYDSVPPDGMSADEARCAYADFLSDIERFQTALDRVVEEWPISCEQFLSNDGINRIAWLGQASLAISTGIPARFKAGFKLLDGAQQRAANLAASGTLKLWIMSVASEEPQLCLNLGD